MAERMQMARPTLPAAPPWTVAPGVLRSFVVATTVQTLQVVEVLSEPVGTALGLAAGATAIGLLLRTGWRSPDCF